ncbi:flagellar hook-length control protein FliK [Colidextribacter sp. OB.20]|uniref:flagellar hook-length control protein FliK n=1 Tax=Colidextribacter sp. OB.20 TaxID=2304568 RepID=UPI00136A6789|nr:flagellar hook-length control protein FliK [Colidextribacter sp. OB.20]NBI10016.1 flagellar hook-length control protein FliK [Colidextribacter sp. OB.20]
MNVNDKWMLEQMQQMAANMATTLPQTGQNTETPKTEKGESFKDLMDKATKDQKPEAVKKEEGAQQTEKPEKTEAVQQTEQPRKVTETKNQDGTITKKINLTAQEAAMVAAGYAVLSPVQPDGTVWMAVSMGENGAENPAVAGALLSDKLTGASRDLSALLVEGEWVVEPSEELTSALEQLLAKAGDPRSVGDILQSLEVKLQNTETQPEIEIVVSAAVTEQAGDQEEEADADVDAQVMTAREPLFKDVKAAPVKVGENFQLDTQRPDMDDRLADAIRYAAQQDLRQIEIKLSPENLGSLTIKLTQASDGTLQVVLHAANAKAASLLSQHADGLNAALQGYSQNSEVRVEVQRNEDSQQAQQEQTNPDGHNRQQRQQQRQEQHSDSQDFVQRLRLGLFGSDQD